MDTNKDIMLTINNGKASKYSPYRWLYYVYLPSIRRWKVGVAKNISNRMNSLGLQSLEGRDRIYEGTDYVVLFKRKYLSNTAFKYEKAIHSQSDLYRVPSTEKPLQSGNTELYWQDIGHTFIDYIPVSDIPIKVKKEPVKKVNVYAGLGYTYNKQLDKFYLRMVDKDGNKVTRGWKKESSAKEKVKLYLSMGYTITN